MLYLMSDIHGDLKSFKELLKYINFNIDRLIILGDVLDKGKKPMESLNLVRELMDKYSGQIILVKGNHELFASMYLDGKLSEKTWLTTGYGGADPGCEKPGGRLSMYCVDNDKEFYA